jgi:SAM-dependent methyltransferase
LEEKKMDDQLKGKWEKGKNNTLHFYRKKLPWKAKAFNTELRFLPDYFDRMIGNKTEVNIADLGAGMFCTTGSLWKTAKVNIYPSDALSDEFNQILKDSSVVPLIPVLKEDMENLSYADEFFDIVHCCNALDHTQNPLKAISEMYRVCKPNGWIYLQHFPNVGEHEKYSGLHIWNLNITGENDCLIWNQKEKFLLSEHFDGFTTVIKKELNYGTEDMVVSILHKV